jgi:hypothetical protein
VRDIFILGDGVHNTMGKHSVRFFEKGWLQAVMPHGELAGSLLPKLRWGFGIFNTKLMNVAMKLNWVCKLLSEEHGLWTDLICAKYFHTNELFLNSSRPQDLNLGTL